MINVNGGILFYIYSWSNGFFLVFFSNLGVGSYQVIIMDMNGCVIILFFIIEDMVLLNCDFWGNFMQYEWIEKFVFGVFEY